MGEVSPWKWDFGGGADKRHTWLIRKHTINTLLRPFAKTGPQLLNNWACSDFLKRNHLLSTQILVTRVQETGTCYIHQASKHYQCWESTLCVPGRILPGSFPTANAYEPHFSFQTIWILWLLQVILNKNRAALLPSLFTVTCATPFLVLI